MNHEPWWQVCIPVRWVYLSGEYIPDTLALNSPVDENHNITIFVIVTSLLRHCYVVVTSQLRRCYVVVTSLLRHCYVVQFSVMARNFFNKWFQIFLTLSFRYFNSRFMITLAELFPFYYNHLTYILALSLIPISISVLLSKF